MRSLQPPDILWIHWRLYNFIANTNKGVLFLPPSDAYVRSSLYLLYTLIKLYYKHTHKFLIKWTGMGEFNSDDHYIYYCGQEYIRRNGVAIMANKRVQNAVLGCSLKNNRMTSVHLQGKPFNITVIQVYAPTSNAEEAEVERFYEDLQDLLELTLKKMSFSL